MRGAALPLARHAPLAGSGARAAPPAPHGRARIFGGAPAARSIRPVVARAAAAGAEAPRPPPAPPAPLASAAEPSISPAAREALDTLFASAQKRKAGDERNSMNNNNNNDDDSDSDDEDELSQEEIELLGSTLVEGVRIALGLALASALGVSFAASGCAWCGVACVVRDVWWVRVFGFVLCVRFACATMHSGLLRLMHARDCACTACARACVCSSRRVLPHPHTTRPRSTRRARLCSPPQLPKPSLDAGALSTAAAFASAPVALGAALLLVPWGGVPTSDQLFSLQRAFSAAQLP